MPKVEGMYDKHNNKKKSMLKMPKTNDDGFRRNRISPGMRLVDV